MTRHEVIKFRTALEASVIELDSSTPPREAILIESSADALDRGHRAAERELAVRNLEALSFKRREAQAALRRIQEGSYGTCVECDEPIAPSRLAALPWAARCIRCQQAMDCRCAAKTARPVLAMAA